MNHRLKPDESLEGEPARIALFNQVNARAVSGILALDIEKPVGWCAFDLIKDLPGLDCGYAVPEARKADVWSIHCVSVLPNYPKEAIVEKMVVAAVEAMRRLGAKTIEGYPPPTVPSDNSFSGTIPIFERQGFRLQEIVNKFYTRMIKLVEPGP
jgi:hypothetical protein